MQTLVCPCHLLCTVTINYITTIFLNSEYNATLAHIKLFLTVILVFVQYFRCKTGNRECHKLEKRGRGIPHLCAGTHILLSGYLYLVLLLLLVTFIFFSVAAVVASIFNWTKLNKTNLLKCLGQQTNAAVGSQYTSFNAIKMCRSCLF